MLKVIHTHEPLNAASLPSFGGDILFDTLLLRDHGNLPDLCILRAQRERVFIDSRTLAKKVSHHSRDCRISPGLYGSHPTKYWVSAYSCAFPIGSSSIFEDAFPTQQSFCESFNHRWPVNIILPGVYVHPAQLHRGFVKIRTLWTVYSNRTVYLFSPSKYTYIASLETISNVRTHEIELNIAPKSVHGTALREELRRIRFQNLRTLFWFINHVCRFLRDMCLHPRFIQHIRRVIRNVHSTKLTTIVYILMNEQRSRNELSRARSIARSFRRSTMTKHDFRVYMRKSISPSFSFTWLIRLMKLFKRSIRKAERKWFLERVNTTFYAFHKLYKVHQKICQVGANIQNAVRVYTNNFDVTMFHSTNIAFIKKDDDHDLFSREAPADFVNEVKPSRNHFNLNTLTNEGTRNSKLKSESNSREYLVGGGVSYNNQPLSGEIIKNYVLNNKELNMPMRDDNMYVFRKYTHIVDLKENAMELPECIVADVPVQLLCGLLTVKDLKTMGKIHNVQLSSRLNKEGNQARFIGHKCHSCPKHYSLFTLKKKEGSSSETETCRITSYPPKPADDRLITEIIHGFCQDIRPQVFEEAGCGVCGQLHVLSSMKPIRETRANLDLLVGEGITRCPRKTSREPIREISGPILDPSCEFICTTCEEHLLNKKMPVNALTRGLWLGPIPLELSNLTFAEQMMIARIRHNRCLVRVSSGRAKMIANCIMFSNPTAELYTALPPSREELSEVLAFVFLGSARPTDEDLQRTPMLVRRNTVAKALEWLKLNHVDYTDLEISKKNLDTYPMSGMPVIIDYRETNTDGGNKIPTAMSKFDTESEEGTTEGPCPFTVHGLTGDEYSALSIADLKIRALEHLEKNGVSIGFRHQVQPESIYKNPQAYPQMFPWLFPYGLGGIGQSRFKFSYSDKAHKKWLLMYHDKRFQNDLYFPMIAFNHEQLKDSTTGSFLLTRRKIFRSVANQLLSLKPGILESISKRMASGEYVKPVTDEEKKCFSILDNLDVIGGSVKGSITSKKHMQNEIWSLVAFKGAPSWFITFSPADNKHPICLYYADKDIHFTHNLRSVTERDLLVLSNPVAAARFFDYMVQMVIKHILGVGELHPGLYGKTSAYYGTVEQQGRLTLHMHMMLWIEGALSPQKIRERLMNNDSKFEEALKAYLEAAHAGEFITGTMDDVRRERAMRDGNHEKTTDAIPTSSPCDLKGNMSEKECIDNTHKASPIYEDPTQTLPSPPPINCECQCDDHSDFSFCKRCKECDSWWGTFRLTVDDLLLRSNVHTCRQGRRPRSAKTDKEHKVSNVKGCLNKDGVCMARFPREFVQETFVDPSDGHIVMKKQERMLNTFSYPLTYLLRCNTDVTSLLSGTSIKAVISYVTDYITKPTLKTHQIFSSAYDVFQKNSEMIGGNQDMEDAARKLLLKIVNALTAKMEIGSPLACLYLLDNPDHYTSHEFAVCWWRNYVSQIMAESSSDINEFDAQNFRKKDHESEYSSDDDEDMYVASDSETDVTREYEQMDVDSEDDSLHENLIGSGDEINEHIDETDDERGGEDKVVLGLEDGQYIPKSYVDDYKYRPIKYEDYTLFRWIQCQRIKKRSAKAVKIFEERVINGETAPNHKGTKFFPFLPDHPLYLTHEATCDDIKSETVVPNFLGGSLPRADQGDREFYCATMLTIFKPWRNASQLKMVHQNWDDAFTSYSFPERESELISNLNLRYECHDARDDFHAEMTKKVNEARRTHNLEEDDYESSDSDEDDYAQPVDVFGLEIVGKNTKSHRDQMSEMESILKRVGWTSEDRKEGRPRVPDIASPDTHRTPGMWKSEVDRMKKEVGKAKRENLDVNSGLKVNSTDAMNTVDKVQLIHASYFRNNYKTKKAEINAILNDVVTSYRLNEAQERAFRIVAHHASTTRPLQLKMLLNGMAGTGKTQVIRALMEMFRRKGESHRFLVLGPTGTSAALLNGSTYHSALGIRIMSAKDTGMGDGNSITVLADVTERLSGVDYIFLDEISMVACHELYAISAQLSTVTKVFDLPFGGINMIFAGDFAQLPPTTGVSLYNNSVAGRLNVDMSVRQQENTIGKMLWQQVTTVVILKENMRQKDQSEADVRLRRCLENMQYAACTAADIAFLKTRIAGFDAGRPRLTDPRFRNVSIITAYNSQKDQINAMGTK